MSFRPRRPTGSSPEAIFAGWVYDFITLRGRILSSSTIGASYRSNGIVLDAKQTPGGSGANAQLFTIANVATDIHGDYYDCTPIGGGATVKVAKPFKLRNSITTETIDGVAYAYTYSSPVARTSVGNGISESQVIIPRFLNGDFILALNIGSSNAKVTGQPTISLFDISNDGRAWGT